MKIKENKEKVLFEHIKSEFIDKNIQQDLKEKIKYAKQIISICKKEYGFDDEVVIRIFKRVYYSTKETSKLNESNRNYMLGMASVWNKNNIKTKENIDTFYNKLEKDITNIIGRELKVTEKIKIERLIYKIREKGQ